MVMYKNVILQIEFCNKSDFICKLQSAQKEQGMSLQYGEIIHGLFDMLVLCTLHYSILLKVGSPNKQSTPLTRCSIKRTGLYTS